MSVRLSHVVRLAVLTAGVALASAPAFAWYGGGGGGTPVPEPSTLALLGVAIPGAAAWIKHRLS
ncbi:MAG: PEP-CTERM sorting domain-containing protein [Alphaproteobacteria bacterium]|nr:PEP-CTERM sorting domain-containing protein [Alphaproteobacteria bacterium]